jgi:hypothetical protein
VTGKYQEAVYIEITEVIMFWVNNIKDLAWSLILLPSGQVLTFICRKFFLFGGCWFEIWEIMLNIRL